MSDFNNKPMSTTDWFMTLFVLAIPLVNLVFYIVWACGVGNRNRVNFCRASVLWTLIFAAVYAGIFALGASTGFGHSM